MSRKFLLLATAAAAVVGPVSVSQADVIISQYYEGTSFNKWIELTNTGSSSVNLSNYNLSLYSNAANTAWKTGGSPNATMGLTGSLAAGGSYVVRHASATTPSYATGSAVSNSSVINFNGDDSIVLWTGSSYSFSSVVDAFGATSSAFGDTSRVRNANVTTGTNADYNAAQWTIFSNAQVDSAGVNTTQRIGFHAFNSANTAPSFTGEPYSLLVDLAATSSFSLGVTATDAENNALTYSVTSGLPSFASFSSSGLFSGSGLTTNDLGTYSIGIQVADGNGGLDTSIISLEVIDSSPAVPEPASMGLLGAAGLMALRRRRAR